MSLLILASASPRRRELLGALGIPFEISPSQTDETLPPGLSLGAALEAVALHKALAALHRRGGAAAVLAADTAVVVDGRVFGKPTDREDALSMLRVLAGREHQVITGVALCTAFGKRSLSVETQVRFRDVGAKEIAWYADTDEPYDKAGAYAIQGRGAFLVASIQGSYTNVVGLPMSETVDLLEEAGLLPWTRRACRA